MLLPYMLYGWIKKDPPNEQTTFDHPIEDFIEILKVWDKHLVFNEFLFFLF